jgi:hypothetical protein
MRHHKVTVISSSYEFAQVPPKALHITVRLRIAKCDNVIRGTLGHADNATMRYVAPSALPAD